MIQPPAPVSLRWLVHGRVIMRQSPRFPQIEEWRAAGLVNVTPIGKDSLKVQLTALGRAKIAKAGEAPAQ